MDAKDEANSIIRDLEKMRQQGISNGGNLDKKTSAMRDKLKKKDTTFVVSFFLGFAGQWPAKPFGDSNARRK